jgi:hypothetical protein
MVPESNCGLKPKSANRLRCKFSVLVFPSRIEVGEILKVGTTAADAGVAKQSQIATRRTTPCNKVSFMVMSPAPKMR